MAPAASTIVAPLEPQRDPRVVVGPHLATRQFLQRPLKLKGAADRVFRDNESLWKAVLEERIRAYVTIRLERFYLSAWLPRAPGLYHTPIAAYARQEALRYQIEMRSAPPGIDAAAKGITSGTRSYRSVFSHQGKSSMLQGGVGCVRLRPLIRDGGAPFWLMSASSSGVAHEGFPVAIGLSLYEKWIERLVEGGALHCTVIGKLQFLPSPVKHLVEQYASVPSLYLEVEDIEPAIESADETLPEVSVAVSFAGDFEKGRGPGIYASYVSFRPGESGALERAARWLKEEYVEGKYHGKILTDFDQTRVHFPEAALSLRKVMGRHVRQGELEQVLEVIFAAGHAQQLFSAADLTALFATAASEARTKIFVSYSHQDAPWMERVRVHLAPLIRQQRVDFLADTDIRSGEQWRERIETMIDSASAAILLVSADFLASDFIADHELPQLLSAARQTGLVILPVFVGAALLEAVPEIIGIQGVNTPDRPLTMLTKGEQDHVLRDLARRALDLSRSGGSEVR